MGPHRFGSLLRLTPPDRVDDPPAVVYGSRDHMLVDRTPLSREELSPRPPHRFRQPAVLGSRREGFVEPRVGLHNTCDRGRIDVGGVQMRGAKNRALQVVGRSFELREILIRPPRRGQTGRMGLDRDTVVEDLDEMVHVRLQPPEPLFGGTGKVDDEVAPWGPRPVTR